MALLVWVGFTVGFSGAEVLLGTPHGFVEFVVNFIYGAGGYAAMSHVWEWSR